MKKKRHRIRKSAPIAKLELHTIIKTEAARLVRATTDQDVCAELIALLKRRLPKRCFVGSGHVVDQKNLMSDRFDVIIAEESNANLVFETQASTSLIPYESVYAVGDVHFMFAPEDLQCFTMKFAALKRMLTRESTPANSYRIGGYEFCSADVPLPEHWYRNPLLSFFLAIDSLKYKVPEQLEKSEDLA